MLKLTKKGLGLLNSQYRSVLRRCLAAQILAATVFLPSQAMADGATVDTSKTYSGDVETWRAQLTTKMGNVVKTEDSAVVSNLYVTSSYTDQLYSSDTGSSGKYGAWLANYGNVVVGKNADGTSVSVNIDNKHNMDAAAFSEAGGAILSGNGDNTEVLLEVYGASFSNNTIASEETSSAEDFAQGGAVAIFNPQDNVIQNSTFRGNYALSVGAVEGGAVFVGWDVDATTGKVAMSGNTFSGNYAGNYVGEPTTNAKLAEFLSNNNNPVAYYAYGGAIYNIGTATSEKDTFEKNYVLGRQAAGGAVYNAYLTETGAKEQVSASGNLTLTGDTFTGNYVSVSSGNNGTASGGAIYNNGKIAITGSTFSQNYVTSAAEVHITGGALASVGTADNTATAILSGNTFTGNYLENTSASANYGGAVYNAEYSELTSSGDTFKNNYVKGNNAVGGAVYNGTYSDDATVTACKYTITGTGTFSGNSAEGSDSAQAGGGAIYNNGTLVINGNSGYGVEFTKNTAASSTYIALGGALANEGNAAISNAEFSENTVTGAVVGGGAVSFMTNEDSSISVSLIEDNKVTGTTLALGGGMLNEGIGIATTLTDVSFTGNTAKATDSTGSARGGALANDNSVYYDYKASTSTPQLSTLLVNASTSAVEFSGNSVSGAEALGGAIYNGKYGALTVATAGNSITVSGNTAANGGAVANAASADNAYMIIEAENGAINISSNTATANGGAVYNDNSDGTAELSAVGSSVFNISSNKAVSGGAVYNAADAAITLNTESSGSLNISQNTASAQGGSLYNEGTTTLASSGGTISFSGNNATNGAGIYNAETGEVNGEIAGTVTFSGNKATGKGGAIYNAAKGVVDIDLTGNGKLVFDKSGDDVYNLGEITITGDSAKNISAKSLRKTVSGTSSSATQVVLNSTLGGTGTYNITTTNLIIGSTGYIDYEPTVNLNNNVITLASGSYLNLDAADKLTNNNMDIASGATVSYKASESKPVELANKVNNSGLINLNDGVLSTVTINTLNSDDGTIKIDVDNDLYEADIINIAGKIYGTTNVTFDLQNSLILPVEERIYFAKTQAEQDLAEYEFYSPVNNGLYEIKIGHGEGAVVNDWYFYRTDALNPEVLAYIDLPRSAVEQSRSLLFDVGRIDRGGCNCWRDECNYKVCRFQDNGGKSRLWAKPLYRAGTFDEPVETDFRMYGVDFGWDSQFDINDQFGIFGSVRDGKYENDGKGADAKIYSNYGSELDITSVIAGLYYRHYFGNLYLSGAVYGGQQMADIKADNGVTSDTDGINFGGQAELGYDIRAGKRTVITPAVKATYDYIKFDDIDTDSSGKKVEFDTINDVELEAGIRVEYQFNDETQLPTIGYIKPSVIQTISSGGSVKISDTEFEDTLENDTLGRIEAGLDAQISESFGLGVFGNYTFGSSYSGWGVGGNIQYKW